MKRIPTLLVLGALLAAFLPAQQAEARDYYVQAPGTYIQVRRPRYYRTYNHNNGWRRHRGWFQRHHHDFDRRLGSRSVYYRWY